MHSFENGFGLDSRSNQNLFVDLVRIFQFSHVLRSKLLGNGTITTHLSCSFIPDLSHHPHQTAGIHFFRFHEHLRLLDLPQFIRISSVNIPLDEERDVHVGGREQLFFFYGRFQICGQWVWASSPTPMMKQPGLCILWPDPCALPA